MVGKRCRLCKETCFTDECYEVFVVILACAIHTASTANLLIKKSKKVSHDDDDGARKSDNNLLDVMRPLGSRFQLWNTKTKKERCQNRFLYFGKRELYTAVSVGTGSITTLKYNINQSQQRKVITVSKHKKKEILKAVIWHLNKCPLLAFHQSPEACWVIRLLQQKQQGNDSVVNSHTAHWCGLLFCSYWLSVMCLLLRLLPCAALHAFLCYRKTAALPNWKVCFLFPLDSEILFMAYWLWRWSPGSALLGKWGSPVLWSTAWGPRLLSWYHARSGHRSRGLHLKIRIW